MPELLLEILSEEIPARMQVRAANYLREALLAELEKLRFEFPVPVESARTFVTPRRLVGVVTALPATIPSQTTAKRGPRVGAPERAVDGFARSAGVSADQLESRTVDGVEYYIAETSVPEQQTASRIVEVIQGIVSSFPWPKSMRWRNGLRTWVRPMHSIVCVFDSQPLQGVVDFASTDDQPGPSINIGQTTSGHRFLAPEHLHVRGFDDYEKALRAAKVIIDPAERRDVIVTRADDLAKKAGVRLREDQGLLNEVAGLIEWPVPLLGTIDPEFLDLPPEVLMTVMRSHQKYFATEDKYGNLADKFIVIADIEASDGGIEIVAGNERVLRARLADAKFFWDQDRKVTLAFRAPALKEIVFHAELGTLDNKMVRTQALAVKVCQWVLDADPDKVRSAVRLAKADLTTGMVGEFPELQGIMGGYYAREDEENDEVVAAIKEHYAPRGPDDTCPTAPVSVAVSLADKIDTLVQFWAIDEKPTGSKDPFALRRAALGVIRLVVENQLRLPLLQAFAAAGAEAKSAKSLLGFFADRLKVHLREKGVRADLIAAVFALTMEDDLVRLLARVDALSSFLDTEEGADLLTAHRRATNIVRIEEKKDGVYRGEWDAALLSEDDEVALVSALNDARSDLEPLLKSEKFKDAMRVLAKLRIPVDGFFANVTVNADDASLRANRLRLLSQITATLELVADFSEIKG